MSDTNTGGPAFPAKLTGPCYAFGMEANDKQALEFHGMTLRDYFAAKAMQGAISSSSDQLDFGPDLGAAWAYQVADAMLKARES